MSIADDILKKNVFPTHLNSAEIKAQLSAEFRRRSFFTAKVHERGWLQNIQGVVADFAEGKIDAGTARADMLHWLDQTGYSSEGKEGIEDLASRRRLDLILKTQREMASNAALVKKETPSTVAAYPAWRLERYGSRAMPRQDWAARWSLAGDSVNWEGALKGDDYVALKNSPIWQALGDGAGGFNDTLGNPYPPFAYSSGMAWSPVSAEDCARLGLDTATAAPADATLSPGEKEIAQSMKSFGKGFADDLQAELEALG
jgi:hypothetical protein